MKNLYLPAAIHRNGVILCCNQAFARFAAKPDACSLCKLGLMDVIPWSGDWTTALVDFLSLKDEWDQPAEHHVTFNTGVMEILMRVDVWPVTWSGQTARLGIGEPVEVTDWANEKPGAAKPYIMGEEIP